MGRADIQLGPEPLSMSREVGAKIGQVPIASDFHFGFPATRPWSELSAASRSPV
jgi:hypothetical protein